MKTSCTDVLYNYIKEKNGEWIKKVELYSVAEDWSPESVGRRLRDLETDNRIEVGYYDGKYAKNLARYRLKGARKFVTFTTEYGTVIRTEV